MTKEIPWLNYCVSVCMISDVPELYDISHVFERSIIAIKEELSDHFGDDFEAVKSKSSFF